MPLVTSTWRSKNVSILQQSLSLALSSWHNLCTHCKRQLLPSPGHGFGPILALWSYKLGIFLLDSHGPPQDCWTHSVHRGVVLTKRWQAEIWRVWSVSPLLLLPPTAQMSQRNTHPASPVSALHATAMPCLFLISIHLFTPVLQIRPPLLPAVWALLTAEGCP